MHIMHVIIQHGVLSQTIIHIYEKLLMHMESHAARMLRKTNGHGTNFPNST